MNEQIKARLKRLPTEPGVYLYYNAANEVIYVGKAKNLKKRVSSYFQKTNHPIKVRRLVAQIETIDFIVLNSESEALLLECDLIKQYRPRYNVLLRDDKSYPYIIVDPRHDFPRLQSYRGEVQENGIEFYGPYASPSTVRKTLEVLHQLFMLRQCGDHDFKTRKRPCLQYQIKRCSAPCVGYIDKAAYGEQVNLVREYLQGKQQHIIELFSEKMNEASQRMDYEEAAHYRDKVRLLQKLHYSSYTIHFQDPVDIICVAKIADRYGAYCFSFRKGHCLGGYFFELQNEQDDETSALLTAFVLQYYQSHQDLPKTIVIGQSLKDKSLLADSLSKRHKQKIAIKTQLNEELQTWYALAQENLKQSIHQHYKHLHDYAEKFTALQLALQMDSPLERIECFDISHTQGQDTVASCVVFNEQGPDKKRYRIYRIEGITPGDDYAAMRQVVMKRYKKLIAQGASLPSVILIDGGKGQLRQAVKVLTELGVDFEQTVVIGVAKGPERKPGWETLYRHGADVPIDLAPDASAFFLIQNARDEAHRFAITKHRNKRVKRGLRSKLEEIPGIGQSKRKQLLDYFGGLEEIKQASVIELAKVPGISHNLATKIANHFRENDS